MLVQDKMRYCVSEKILPGPFQWAPALRTLHQGRAGPCPPPQGTRPHCQVGSGKAQVRLSCSVLWVLLCQPLELGTALPEDPSVLPRAIEC